MDNIHAVHHIESNELIVKTINHHFYNAIDMELAMKEPIDSCTSNMNGTKSPLLVGCHFKFLKNAMTKCRPCGKSSLVLHLP